MSPFSFEFTSLHHVVFYSVSVAQDYCFHPQSFVLPPERTAWLTAFPPKPAAHSSSSFSDPLEVIAMLARTHPIESLLSIFASSAQPSPGLCHSASKSAARSVSPSPSSHTSRRSSVSSISAGASCSKQSRDDLSALASSRALSASPAPDELDQLLTLALPEAKPPIPYAPSNSGSPS